MTILNVSQVSKQFKLNRSTIYRAVSSGRLSRRADGTFDLAEVIRCFGEPGQQKEAPILIPIDTVELERVRKEYAEYKRQAIEREDWLKGQIDRMQTLLELKSETIASETSHEHQTETHSNTVTNTSVIQANEAVTPSTVASAMSKQHVVNDDMNVASATVQHFSKKKGLLGRLVSVILDK
jgi:hypothetical protein